MEKCIIEKETLHLIDIKVYNAAQIGGCFTVITTSKAKIMVDYGLPLPGAKAEQEDFDWEHDTVDAVFITHYHGDHVGKILDIPSNIPIYMGRTTRQIMLNIHKALVRIPKFEDEQKKWIELLRSNRIKEVEENTPIMDIDGIIVTPYSVDHSAYDAYMYLIEADGKVVLHTGDFRGHGYRGSKMINVIKYYVHKNGRLVDYLITEGTMMGDRKNERVKKESELYEEAFELFKEHRYVFLVISSTNLDSLVSFYHAAQDNNMYMYCYNYYFYNQLKTFSHTAGKKAPWYQFKNVYTIDFDKTLSNELWDKDKTQEELMREHGFLCVIKAEDKYNEWIERFKDKNPIVIYSMWDGYISEEKGKEAYNKEWADFFKPYKESNQYRDLHTSGHATAKMIASVIQAVEPQEAIIPMHTENVEGFRELKIDNKYKQMIMINGKEGMGLFEKTKDDWDCRAIPNKFLNNFLKGGIYHPFVELVNEHDELQLCFRGNSNVAGQVSIYRENHAMFTITPERVFINPKYLKYCENWKELLDKLIKEYKFNQEKEIKLGKVKYSKNNKTGVESYSCSFAETKIAVNPKEGNVMDNLDKLYLLLSEIFDCFLSEDEEKCVDRFLEWKNHNDKVYLDRIPPKYYEHHKKIEIEKRRQQQLFALMKFQQDGYYFYDMEFQQKHKNKSEQDIAKEKGESNKPDMQAIRFDREGKPQALVFVEVKCTENAYKGERSGLYKHIDAMQKYPNDALERRRREAFLILHQYEQLGIYKLDRKLDWKEYAQLPLEIVLVFTDEAIALWKNDESIVNWTDEEIVLPDGNKALLVRM